jgi:hypothetical protein
MKVQNKSGLTDRIIQEYQQVAAANGQEMWVATASSLILQVTIPAGGTNNLQFGVTTNDQPNALSTETRLNINDEFVIIESALMLYGVMGTATGPATSLVNRYWTYAPWQLSSTFITLEPFYDNGVFNLSVNGQLIIKNMDTNQFKFVPRTEEGAASAATTIVNATIGSVRSNDDAFAEMSPTITLSGAKTNVPVLTFKENIVPVTNFAFVTSAANDVYFSINIASWVCRGILAQNAANFQGSRDAMGNIMVKAKQKAA